VETIVAKALEKDKARRYASAGELAADLRRFLSHEPIRARPASALYQMRKFARRHKALVAAVLGIGRRTTSGLAAQEGRRQADDFYPGPGQRYHDKGTPPAESRHDRARS
jgi:hypothetical protein